MKYIQADLGVSTADAENVSVHFYGSDLKLTFIDWREQPRELTFRDTLAFRWQGFDEPEDAGIRGDEPYEVLDSEWLIRQCELAGVPPEGYQHYKLCFNALDSTFDVICWKE